MKQAALAASPDDGAKLGGYLEHGMETVPARTRQLRNLAASLLAAAILTTACGTTNALKPAIWGGDQTIILRTPPGAGSMPRAS